MKLKSFLIAASLLASTMLAHADEVIVAVAANFTEPVKEISEAFEAQTGHKITLSFGATGNFYTQIKNGAPFEVFLAADSERPAKLVEEGYGIKGTEFTYAIGTLVLYSAKPDVVKGPETLKDAAIKHISYCNPDAAPYGKAAVETMQALKVFDEVKPRLVEGANISQAYQFVETGNTEIGFVALSQVIKQEGGSQWVVPQEYYNPIKQDAVLLKTGESNDAAKAFLTFLKQDPKSAEIIKKYGYAIAAQ